MQLRSLATSACKRNFTARKPLGTATACALRCSNQLQQVAPHATSPTPAAGPSPCCPV